MPQTSPRTLSTPCSSLRAGRQISQTKTRTKGVVLGECAHMSVLRVASSFSLPSHYEPL